MGGLEKKKVSGAEARTGWRWGERGGEGGRSEGAREPHLSRPWPLVRSETAGINGMRDSYEKGSEVGRGWQCSSDEVQERTLE